MVELPLVPSFVLPLLLVEEHDDTFHNPCRVLAKGTKRDSDDLLLNSEKKKDPYMDTQSKVSTKHKWVCVLRIGKVHGTLKTSQGTSSVLMAHAHEQALPTLSAQNKY